MAQIALPQSDVTNDLWTLDPPPSPGELNPVSGRIQAADTKYLTSRGSPYWDTFEVQFSKLEIPAGGRHTLTVSMRKTDAGGAPATVTLLQGDQAIASWALGLQTTFEDQYFALTPAQVDQITNYSDLRVRVTASGSGGASGSGSGAGTVLLPCCPTPLPRTLHGTISNRSGGCTCLSSASFALTYSDLTGYWSGGPAGGCGAGSLRFDLRCVGTQWQLFSTLCGITGRVPNGANCSPFQVSWDSLTCPAACGGSGSFSLTITE
jgi:hypothetical protein